MPRKLSKSARPVAEIVRKVIHPVVARRGFGSANLIAAWPEIMGPDFARVTRPHRIVWPAQDADAPGVLEIGVDGPTAVLIRHEADQIVERVNTFLGFRAVARLKLKQTSVTGPAETAGDVPASPEVEPRLDAALGPETADEPLQRALRALGRGVLSES